MRAHFRSSGAFPEFACPNPLLTLHPRWARLGDVGLRPHPEWRPVMDARTFLKLAQDPAAWRRKGRQLRQCADGLCELYTRTLSEARGKSVAAEKYSIRDHALNYLVTARMLYGFALEAAFKGYILARSPDKIEFALSTDGTGEVQAAEIKQFGVPLGQGHDLLRLAAEAGALSTDGSGVFTLETDVKAFREILRLLTHDVRWAGKYPVPTSSGTSYAKVEDVPSAVLGFHVFDWIGPVLDKYLGPATGNGQFGRPSKKP